MVTEINIYVPHTAYSRLSKILQEADNRFSVEHNSPRVRFTERGGPTVGFECLRSNPWASDWNCGRKDCLPCESRDKIAAEIEKARENGTRPIPKKDSMTIPACTTECRLHTRV